MMTFSKSFNSKLNSIANTQHIRRISSSLNQFEIHKMQIDRAQPIDINVQSNQIIFQSTVDFNWFHCDHFRLGLFVHLISFSLSRRWWRCRRHEKSKFRLKCVSQLRFLVFGSKISFSCDIIRSFSLLSLLFFFLFFLIRTFLKLTQREREKERDNFRFRHEFTKLTIHNGRSKFKKNKKITRAHTNEPTKVATVTLTKRALVAITLFTRNTNLKHFNTNKLNQVKSESERETLYTRCHTERWRLRQKCIYTTAFVSCKKRKKIRTMFTKELIHTLLKWIWARKFANVY